jgi:hypothetical protein
MEWALGMGRMLLILPPTSYLLKPPGPRCEFDHYIIESGEKNGKKRYCHDKCTRERDDCYRNARRRPHQFEAIDTAIDWVKRHRRELIVGSVIVIAGVVFVVVVVGSGGSATVLAPAVLLVSAEAHEVPARSEGSE